MCRFLTLVLALAAICDTMSGAPTLLRTDIEKQTITGTEVVRGLSFHV